jgi:hypothetical protein
MEKQTQLQRPRETFGMGLAGRYTLINPNCCPTIGVHLRDLRPFYPDPSNDFAEITVRAAPSEKETEVLLSPAASKTLRHVFGEDFECQRHNVLAAVEFQIAAASIGGDYPHVGSSSFRVEVTRIRVSRNAGQEASGALLTSAAWGAIGAFLNEWEESQQNAGGASGSN